MNDAWALVLARVGASSHLVTGDGTSAMAHDAVAAVGLSADVLLVDLAQQTLSPVHPGTHALGQRPGQSAVIGAEQLEPGDWLLFCTDGITEARNDEGDLFDEPYLVEFTERAAAADLSAPDTLRRLVIAVQEFGHGRMRDDVTLVVLDWPKPQWNRLLPRALSRRDELDHERSEPGWPGASDR